MVLCFRIFYHMFSLKGICIAFILNFWKWLLSFISRIIGCDDLEKLHFYERKLLKSFPSDTKTERVSVGKDLEIWTVSIKHKQSSTCPIVFLHSLGYGACFWALNLANLSRDRTVYALDMLGFGRSSRISFSSRLADIENEFIESLEVWRRKIGLEAFILLGHGFGGYIAFLYTSRFPDRVKHVMFVEPWGFDADPKHYKRFRSFQPPIFPVTSTTKLAAFLITYLNHFSLLRFVGPGWGVDLIKKFRGDLLSNFSKAPSKDDVAQYLYYWNASHPPSGEKAFHMLSLYSGYARHPLLFRINSIAKNVPITFIMGSRSSYVGRDIGSQVKQLRSGSYVDIQVLNGAGHYVFVEKRELFNRLIGFICQEVDNLKITTEGTESRLIRKRSDSLPSILIIEELGSKHLSDSSESLSSIRHRQHKASCCSRTISKESSA